MRRLPSLGPRGEGWVVLQGLFLLAIAAAGLWAGAAWSGALAQLSSFIGVVVVGAGAALFIRGVLDLGRNLTPMPRPLGGASLVQSGAYALVRHPLYGGLTIAAVGWGFLTASPAALLLALGLGIFFDLKARREEAWLIECYAAYDDYIGRTRRLIPWLY
jgi:protein-S-isoprenylcysteine O-methyltransferase Ste14